MKPLFAILSSFIVLLIVLVYSCGSNQYGNPYDVYIDTGCPEQQNFSDSFHQFKRSWLDLDFNNYCMDYTTYYSLYIATQKSRLNFQPNNSWEYYQFWGKLYEHLYQYNSDKISALVDSLSQIQNRYQLSRNQFANVIVSFVQDIPYSYVLSNRECENLEDKSHPCIDQVEYGILSPYEFLHTLSGDCDTRTVLLYTILKQFNYSPRIVVSHNYAHSMLLLDVLAAGDYVYEHGKKYYFWETTSTGWKAGIIPPDMNDLKYWEIVLN